MDTRSQGGTIYIAKTPMGIQTQLVEKAHLATPDLPEWTDGKPVPSLLAGQSGVLLAAHRLAPAGSVVVAGPGDTPGLPLLTDRTMIAGRPTAYVCRRFVCRMPVTSTDDLERELATAGQV